MSGLVESFCFGNMASQLELLQHRKNRCGKLAFGFIYKFQREKHLKPPPPTTTKIPQKPKRPKNLIKTKQANEDPEKMKLETKD